MAKRRSVYEGGEWSIGGVTPYRAPHTLTAIEAATRAREIRAHWLPIAEQRRDAGRKWYAGICEVYRCELRALDARIAEQTAPAQREKVAA